MLQTNQELTQSVKLEPVQTAEQEADGRRGCSRSTKQAGAPSGSAPPVILKITGDTQKSKLKSEELGAMNSSSPDAKTTRSYWNKHSGSYAQRLSNQYWLLCLWSQDRWTVVRVPGPRASTAQMSAHGAKHTALVVLLPGLTCNKRTDRTPSREESNHKIGQNRFKNTRNILKLWSDGIQLATKLFNKNHCLRLTQTLGNIDHS